MPGVCPSTLTPFHQVSVRGLYPLSFIKTSSVSFLHILSICQVQEAAVLPLQNQVPGAREMA